MEHVTAVLKFIDEYGLALVLVVLFLRWITPKLDEGWKFIMKKADGEEEPKEDAEHKNLKQMLEVNSEINSLLTEIVAKYNSHWSTLWQMHNGELTLGGVPFIKISATHQKASSNCYSWANRYQGVPTSFFADCVDGESDFLVLCSEDHDKYDAIRSIMHSIGVTMAYLFGVTDARGNLIGVLTLTYRTNDVFLSENQIAELREYADRAAIHLDRLASLAKTTKK